MPKAKPKTQTSRRKLLAALSVGAAAKLPDMWSRPTVASVMLPTHAAGSPPEHLLAGFSPRIGGTTAVALELHTSEEADALVTLLALYEGRSSVAFHQILKLLCDAYETPALSRRTTRSSSGTSVPAARPLLGPEA